MHGLPPKMHKKNGSFYFVHRNKWTFLAGDRPTALHLYRSLIHGLSKDIPHAPAWLTMERYIPQVYTRARKNARKRQIPFTLTRDEFNEIVERARHCCEVTRIPFELRLRPGSARRPFAPSLDRIKAAVGYTKGNCRLVCGAVNAAISDWGEDIFWKIISATSRKFRGDRLELRGSPTGENVCH